MRAAHSLGFRVHSFTRRAFADERVYEADRPEIFFKALAQRVSGPDEPIHVRRDSTWDVPEPELAIFMTSSSKIVAYTCGNDVSSRSIEGENPLYLPQAKTYERCMALGPVLYVPAEPIDPNLKLTLTIDRGGEQIFEESQHIRDMKRTLPDLASWLFRECAFPAGAFLSTGTSIIPEETFTLTPDDVVNVRQPALLLLRPVACGSVRQSCERARVVWCRSRSRTSARCQTSSSAGQNRSSER